MTSIQKAIDDRPVMPLDVAESVVLATSYKDESKVHDALTWLRKNMPLAIAEIPGYDPLWIITKHQDIIDIERDPKLFTSGVQNPILNNQASDAFMRQMTNGTYRLISTVSYMDPPEHTAVRGITAAWFMPARIKKLEEQIRIVAKDSVGRLLDFDGECDFVKDFALYYPLRVIMTVLGVPPEDEPRMLKLTQEFFGTQDPEEQRSDIVADPEAMAKQWAITIKDFFDYFSGLSGERRANPRDDLITLIANAKNNGEYFSDDVINSYYIAIATAGHDTTSSTTAGGMHGLIAFPEQFELARSAAPEVSGGLVEEAVRWTSPVRHFMRAASGTAHIRGVRIEENDRIFLSYPSANRDEEVFDRPFEFDIRRNPNKQLGFGFGPHVCLGQHLAKLEMRILFEEMMPKLKSMEVAATPKQVQTNFVGGYKSMPVRFKKA